ncbi:MAG TPA: 2-dehydropantoate 2-reductase [archaeon]|nr:2-dehydropantoate 2-reductase [archaeon]
MKTAILGPGALGCLFGAYLTEGGLDVTLIDHRPERAGNLEAAGIFVQGVRGGRHVRVKATAESGALGPVDLVMVCVKAYDTEEALGLHRILVGSSTTVWSVQNGLGNVETMGRLIPVDRLVGGSTTMGANLLAPGRVHHAGEGETFIGELDGRLSPRVEQIAKAVSVAGIPVQARSDIQQLIWRKVLINVAINALTAILRVRNGVLVEHESTMRVMEEAVREAVRAAATRGICFAEDEALAQAKEVARRTAGNRSSMLADMLAGRRTEIDYLNGAIAAMVPAPVNRVLADLVWALEASSASRLDASA